MKYVCMPYWLSNAMLHKSCEFSSFGFDLLGTEGPILYCISKDNSWFLGALTMLGKVEK